MKKVILLCSIGSFLSLVSAMICGFWMRANPDTITSSVSFHMNCGIFAIVLAGMAFILFIISSIRAKKVG